MKRVNFTTERCDTCRFCDQGIRVDNDGKVLEYTLACFRFPPGMVKHRLVSGADYCGEYRRSVTKTFRPMRLAQEKP